MPYTRLSDLPDSVRDNLPTHAQEIYRAAFNLETAVGQARVCVFPAFWLGATTLQTAFCEEEQRSQGAGKACNRACSALTQTMKCLIIENF